MDWTAIKGVVDELITEKLSGLQEAFHAQTIYLEDLINKLEASKKAEKRTGSAGKVRPKPNVEDHSSPDNPKRPKTAQVSLGKEVLTEEVKKEKEEEAKKKAEFKAQKDLEIKKHQDEIKKKKQEELEKKKEQEEKKREAKEKAKEEENKKKEEAKKKKVEEEAKKKEEFKAKQAQEAEKKRKELEEKNKQIEEKKKKKEEEKKKSGEEEKKEPKKKEDKKEEKKKVSPTKKKEVTKKAEEEKKEEPVAEIKIDRPSYSTLAEVQEALKQLTENGSEIPDPPPFTLLSKSKEALKVINIIEEELFYLTQLAPVDTILIFRLFFQLAGQSLPESNEEAWAQCQTYLADIRNKDAHDGKTLSEMIEEKASTFDFSFENIEKCEQLARGHHGKLNPNYHKDSSPLAGCMAFIVRDGLEYAGIAKSEGPSKLYGYLLYKQTKLTESA
ncbi:unnamed protein product [Blepharisma stoltei]|uniref:Uncharacterized protein n=1 Tax=Blepharisma stoltei TaxID=1481888 RepID=A0AAU9IXW4_9CILI|nr:unnamed protein product [Blepharisma stoltei]